MNQRDLKRYVSFGEGFYIEFKRRTPQPERLAKEVIAFANARGGKLFVGVDDDGTVRGVKDVEEERFVIRRALDEHCDPPVEVAIEAVPVTRKREVIVVDVPESPEKPHYLVGQANGDARARVPYVRVADQSIEASREAVRLMKHERNPKDVRFEFGDKERTLMRYLDRHEQITVEAFARLVDIPRRRASQTLVLLAKANLLRFYPDEHADYFTLAYEVE
jgi:predicted HTH transcriptional regulator